MSSRLLLPQAWPDDDVDGSDLVFEGQENHSTGGFWPLADGDDAAAARKLPILEIIEDWDGVNRILYKRSRSKARGWRPSVRPRILLIVSRLRRGRR